MTETGRVQAVSGGVIIVQREVSTDLRSDACFGCMNQECRTNHGQPRANRPHVDRPQVGLIIAENRTGQELRPGQLVETGVTASALIIQIITVLCPPLLGFAAVYALTGLAFPALGEGARAACGVLGLFTVAEILYLIRRKFPSKTKTSIVRIL
jgi:sigma-E factor negative regulatory protein RseC